MSTVFRDHFAGGIDSAIWTAGGSPTTSGDKAIIPSGSALTSVASMPEASEFHFDLRLKAVPTGDNYFSNVVCINVGDDKVMHFDLYVSNHGGITYVNVQPVLPLHGGVGALALVNIPAKYWKEVDGDLVVKDFNFYIEDHTLSLFIGNDLVYAWTDTNILSVEAPFYFFGAALGITAELSKVVVKTDSGRTI